MISAERLITLIEKSGSAPFSTQTELTAFVNSMLCSEFQPVQFQPVLMISRRPSGTPGPGTAPGRYQIFVHWEPRHWEHGSA